MHREMYIHTYLCFSFFDANIFKMKKKQFKRMKKKLLSYR